MARLPARPDIDQLKRQAKELLAQYRRGAPEAVARFRAFLPAARELPAPHVVARAFRLHDAQSCLAREYGFNSWADMSSYVAAVRAANLDAASLGLALSKLIYAGDIAGGTHHARPHVAARFLQSHPNFIDEQPWIACAIGDVARIRQCLQADARWIDSAQGPLGLPPLVAACHSSLVRLPAYGPHLHESIRLLLAAGADPNAKVMNRWSSAEEGQALSALYGVAGQNHDAELTRLLLEAGADPDDGESLYHSLEAPACTRLLLAAGARVSGTNALYRSLDLDDLETFRLLLAHAEGAPELEDSSLLFWAIRRHRSAAHIELLLAAGVPADGRNAAGATAYQEALRQGLPDVAHVLARAGSATDVTDEDLFMGACARGDEVAARQMQARRPDLPHSLDAHQHRLLPDLAAAGCREAVAVMLAVGWPADVPGGDWTASALNHAVFRGDVAMVELLLAHGASWQAQHGFGDNVLGTLSWASMNMPNVDGDWPACAEVLAKAGLPPRVYDPAQPGGLIIDGKWRAYADDVIAVLEPEARRAARP